MNRVALHYHLDAYALQKLVLTLSLQIYVDVKKALTIYLLNGKIIEAHF